MPEDRNEQLKRWYDPVQQTGEHGSEPERKAYGKRKRTKIISLCISGAIVLLAGYAAIFGIGDGAAEKLWLAGADDWEYSDDGSPEKDNQDFFDGYVYEEASGENHIPRAEIGTGTTLELESIPDDGEMSLGELYGQCAPSVVALITKADGEEYAWGSGVIFTEDGYILTNAHVLSDSDAVSVIMSDDSEYEAKLVGTDSMSDLAVLKVDAEDLPAARFGNSLDLSIGDGVAAIGNPLEERFRGTMTTGIISGLNRSVSCNGHYINCLQTDAALNEGNSGGPLINMYGQVVGITNMKMMSDYSTIEGMGFAIPSDVVKKIADELIATGRVSGYPTIGITAGSITEEIAELYGIESGLYIIEVDERSDAYAKGVRQGDILIEVNGIEVDSVQEVNEIKERYKVGDRLRMTFRNRNGIFSAYVVLMDKYDLEN